MKRFFGAIWIGLATTAALGGIRHPERLGTVDMIVIGAFIGAGAYLLSARD